MDHDGPSEVSSEILLNNSDSDIGSMSRNGSPTCSLNVTQSDCSTSSTSSFSDSSEADDSDSDSELASITDLSSILASKFIGPAALNGKLHPALNVSKFEVVLMILHISMRHRMTDYLVHDLLEFVNEIVGIPNGLGVSVHLFNRLFKFGREPMIHFYCPNCQLYLGTEKKLMAQNCEKENTDEFLADLNNVEGDLNSEYTNKLVKCKNGDCDWRATVSSLNSGYYFLTLGLREQIREVLSKPGIQFVKKERLENVLSDIVDGKEYKFLSKEGKILSNPDALTLTMSTDGSPVFKSGPNSLWPVHFYINEIEPSQRFKADKIILGGLWFGKSEANIQMFLKPIIDELLVLQTKGVVWKNEQGNIVESPLYLLCCCTDSVARPKVQLHMQFNGAYACSMCLHPNTSMVVEETEEYRTASNEVETRVKRKKVMRYLRGQYDRRTNKSLRDHMELASLSGCDHIMGSTGVSVLCELKHFNVVHGFVIDYMHAILIGTVKRLVNLWFDSSSHKEPYYIGTKVRLVDKLLETITLPSGFRPPRPISDRVHWHANEWRSFLLYFGLTALDDMLPLLYYNHFKKLVAAIYSPSKDSILYAEINESHKLLQQFVWEYQDLYGPMNMVYNVHVTSHMAEVVLNMGPLWAHSAFPFESSNGRLVKLAMGTKGVATQVARKHNMTNSVSKLLSHGYDASEKIVDFCCNVLNFNYLKHSCKGKNGETMLGKDFFFELDTIQQRAFVSKNYSVSSSVPAVNRAVVENILYHSRLTTRQIKACDSCIRLISGEFALIDLIVLYKKVGDNQCETLFLITKLNIATDASPIVPHIKQCCIDSYGEMEVITSDEISRKCMFFSCSDRNFVCEISNFYESD